MIIKEAVGTCALDEEMSKITISLSCLCRTTDAESRKWVIVALRLMRNVFNGEASLPHHRIVQSP